MGFFNKKEQRALPEQPTMMAESVSYNNVGGFLFGNGADHAMKLSVVWRCVNLISDSIAQMPIDVLLDEGGFKTVYKEHPAYNLLNRQPCRKYNRYTFVKMLLTDTLISGNGYALIKRDANGRPESLIHFEPAKVALAETPDDIVYMTPLGKYQSCDMIHLKMYSKDGVRGISPLEYGADAIGLAFDQEKQASSYYRSGCAVNSILKCKGSKTDAQKKQIRQAWQQSMSGSGNSLAILEGEWDFIKLGGDAQTSMILDARAWSLTEICRIFGISPTKAYATQSFSYASVEAGNIDFLQSLTPYVEALELELSNKLFLPSERDRVEVKFKTESILRCDKAALAAWYSSMLTNGIMTINEVRKEMGLGEADGCDKNIIPVNMAPVSSIVKNSDKTNDKETE